MLLTIPSTEQIEVTFPIHYEFAEMFILFKDEKKCIIVNTSSYSGDSYIKEDSTPGWIDYMIKNGKKGSYIQFAQALREVVEKFETYYTKEHRKAFAKVTLHDPMIENTLYETQNA